PAAAQLPGATQRAIHGPVPVLSDAAPTTRGPWQWRPSRGGLRLPAARHYAGPSVHHGECKPTVVESWQQAQQLVAAGTPAAARPHDEAILAACARDEPARLRLSRPGQAADHYISARQ